MKQEAEQLELQKKLQENAEVLKELAKADPKNAEDFNKLQKSDPNLEDLKKANGF